MGRRSWSGDLDLVAIKSCLDQCTAFLEFVVNREGTLHIALDFSELHTYLFPPVFDEKPEKLVQWVAPLQFMLGDPKLSGSFVLLPPYELELRDQLAYLLATGVEAMLARSTEGDSISRSIRALVRKHGDLGSIPSEKIPGILRTSFPDLYTFFERALAVSRYRQAHSRLDALFESNRIVHFEKYMDGTSLPVMSIPIDADDLLSEIHPFYLPIDDIRQHERTLQTHRDAQACLYIDRINRGFSEKECMILVSHSTDLIVGTLDTLLLGNYQKDFPHDVGGISLLVPIQSAFILLCGYQTDDAGKPDWEATLGRLADYAAETTEFGKTLEFLRDKAPRDGKKRRELVKALDEIDKVARQLVQISSVGRIAESMAPYAEAAVAECRHKLKDLGDNVAGLITQLADSEEIQQTLYDESEALLMQLAIGSDLQRFFRDVIMSGKLQLPADLAYNAHYMHFEDSDLRLALRRVVATLRTGDGVGSALAALRRRLVEKGAIAESWLAIALVSAHTGSYRSAIRHIQRCKSMLRDSPHRLNRLTLLEAVANRDLFMRGDGRAYGLVRAQRLLESLHSDMSESESYLKELSIVEYLRWATHEPDGDLNRAVDLSSSALSIAEHRLEEDPYVRMLIVYLLNNLAYLHQVRFFFGHDPADLDSAESYMAQLEGTEVSTDDWEPIFYATKAGLRLAQVIAGRVDRPSGLTEALKLADKARESSLESERFRDLIWRVGFFLQNELRELLIADIGEASHYHNIAFATKQCGLQEALGEGLRQYESEQAAAADRLVECPHCSRPSI